MFQRRAMILQAESHDVNLVKNIIVQQDAVDDICRLPDVWRQVLHVGGDYFWSLKKCDCSKNIFFAVKSNVTTSYWMT